MICAKTIEAGGIEGIVALRNLTRVVFFEGFVKIQKEKKNYGAK
jgi:hypothetical protein